MYLYKKEMIKQFKFPFKGLEKIEQSYSQALQDMFVLSVLDGKEKGTFLEIGASSPIFISNTYLLESVFKWNGISIDINKGMVGNFSEIRKAQLIIDDATKIDYLNILEEYNWFHDTDDARVDYLQVDIEPSSNTFLCLKRLPFRKWRFSVITYETDYYDPATDKSISESIRRESREIFDSFGYVLVNGNVENAGGDPFEDWYLDSQYFSSEIINKFKRESDIPMRAKDYMLSMPE